MSLGLRICVGIIFAILLFGGAFLIALSQWEVMSNHGIPMGRDRASSWGGDDGFFSRYIHCPLRSRSKKTSAMAIGGTSGDSHYLLAFPRLDR